MGLRDRLRINRPTTEDTSAPAPWPWHVSNLWVEPHTSPDPNQHIVYGHNEEHYREVVERGGREVVFSVRGTSDMIFDDPEAVAQLKAEAAALHAAGKTVGIHSEQYLAMLAARPKLNALDEQAIAASAKSINDYSHEL